MGKLSWLVKAESRVYNLYYRDIRGSCRLHSSSKPNPCGLKLVFLTFLLSQTLGHVRSNQSRNFLFLRSPIIGYIRYISVSKLIEHEFNLQGELSHGRIHD